MPPSAAAVREHPFEHTTATACDQQAGRGRPHVIDEALFRDVLIRERRRTDRSNHPFVLLLVEAKRAAPSSIWGPAIDAVAAAKPETGILGWFESRAVIGVILPQIDTSRVTDASERVDARVRRELAKRFDADTVGSFTLRLHVHPEPIPPGDEELRAVDSLLYPQRRWRQTRGFNYCAIKRGLDIIGSLMLLAAVFPLLVLIAVLVKLTSRGPILFRQMRIGQAMKPFTIVKFRTMRVGADHKLHHDFTSSFITASGQVDEAGQNGFFKLTRDPRITPVGRILRKTSVDELPQLWNVLRGDMSLVGPRPPIAYELKQYKPWHRRRVLEAKPGITGLWQVSGRSRTTFDDMVRLDLRYARTCSLWTDIKILVATPTAVISGKGAC
jgi:lipopolysaccharide/colanic/teichoic acid biosynthesis glycosyltransferase